MKKSFYTPGKLYFFPAFLPLIEILPWLVTLIGMVVATASFSFPLFWKKYKAPLIIATIISITTGIYFINQTQANQEPLQTGTRLVEHKDLPTPNLYKNIKIHSRNDPQAFQEIWSITTKHQILSSPLILDNTLIYGSYDNTVEAISINNGAPVWSLPQNTYATSLAKDKQGNIYAGEGLHETQTASLTSFNSQTKTVNWQRKFTGHIEGTPVIDEINNRIWFSTGPGGLWAINKENADIHLHLPLGHIDSKPLLHNGNLYIQAQENPNLNLTTLFALNQNNGEIIWQLSQAGQPWGSPLMHKDGKTILTTTGLGQIGINKRSDKGWAYAITTKGKVHWKKDLPDMPIQPAIYLPEQNLFINTTKSGELIALNANTGATKWRAKAGSGFMSAATLISHLSQPMIASTSTDGIFTIRNAQTGKEIRRYKLGKDSSSSPIAHNDTIYVPSAYSIVAFGGLKSLLKK